jgi:hypothetical protein
MKILTHGDPSAGVVLLNIPRMLKTRLMNGEITSTGARILTGVTVGCAHASADHCTNDLSRI